MRNLNQFILERLKLNKDTKVFQYKYHPKNFDELRSLLEQLLDKRGKDADLNDIDVSKITSFGEKITSGKYSHGGSGLFYGLDPHNIKIDRWNVSNVENMNSMFEGCENFTGQGLENWNVSKVEDMADMFFNCEKFTGQGLKNWNVSGVNDMACMFSYCENFNCDLSNWDISNVEDMRGMFDQCINFTGKGLENWKPLKCKNMRAMFDDCTSLKNKPSWYKE